MNANEARAAATALYLQSAAMAGLEVDPQSTEAIVSLVAQGFDRVGEGQEPLAVASLLTLIAAALEIAQQTDGVLSAATVEQAQDEICPVYPFD